MPEFDDGPLHELWTWAVGLPGYDKQKWLRLESLLHRGLAAEKKLQQLQQPMLPFKLEPGGEFFVGLVEPEPDVVAESRPLDLCEVRESGVACTSPARWYVHISDRLGLKKACTDHVKKLREAGEHFVTTPMDDPQRG